MVSSLSFDSLQKLRIGTKPLDKKQSEINRRKWERVRTKAERSHHMGWEREKAKAAEAAVNQKSKNQN